MRSMSNRSRKIDQNQLAFDFEAKLEVYQSARLEVLEACQESGPIQPVIDSADEACVEIAAAIKRMLRETNLSREELVDEINDYFGLDRADESGDESGRKPLTIHMFNHYLSKPVYYPIPAFYLIAILAITGSLEVARVLVEPIGARIISGPEVRQMALGQLDEMITEMQKLKRELKGGKT